MSFAPAAPRFVYRPSTPLTAGDRAWTKSQQLLGSSPVDYNKAEDALEDASRLFQKEKNYINQGLCQLALGRMQNERWLANPSKPSIEEAESYMSAGNAFLKSSDDYADDALYCFKLALPIMSSANDPFSLGTCFERLGYVQKLKSDRPGALKFYETALSKMVLDKAVDCTNLMVSLASEYIYVDQYNKAEKMFNDISAYYVKEKMTEEETNKFALFNALWCGFQIGISSNNMNSILPKIGTFTQTCEKIGFDFEAERELVGSLIDAVEGQDAKIFDTAVDTYLDSLPSKKEDIQKCTRDLLYAVTGALEKMFNKSKSVEEQPGSVAASSSGDAELDALLASIDDLSTVAASNIASALDLIKSGHYSKAEPLFNKVSSAYVEKKLTKDWNNKLAVLNAQLCRWSVGLSIGAINGRKSVEAEVRALSTKCATELESAKAEGILANEFEIAISLKDSDYFKRAVEVYLKDFRQQYPIEKCTAMLLKIVADLIATCWPSKKAPAAPTAASSSSGDAELDALLASLDAISIPPKKTQADREAAKAAVAEKIETAALYVQVGMYNMALQTFNEIVKEYVTRGVADERTNKYALFNALLCRLIDGMEKGKYYDDASTTSEANVFEAACVQYKIPEARSEIIFAADFTMSWKMADIGDHALLTKQQRKVVSQFSSPLEPIEKQTETLLQAVVDGAAASWKKQQDAKKMPASSSSSSSSDAAMIAAIHTGARKYFDELDLAKLAAKTSNIVSKHVLDAEQARLGSRDRALATMSERFGSKVTLKFDIQQLYTSLAGFEDKQQSCADDFYAVHLDQMKYMLHQSFTNNPSLKAKMNKYWTTHALTFTIVPDNYSTPISSRLAFGVGPGGKPTASPSSGWRITSDGNFDLFMRISDFGKLEEAFDQIEASRADSLFVNV